MPLGVQTHELMLWGRRPAALGIGMIFGGYVVMGAGAAALFQQDRLDADAVSGLAIVAAVWSVFWAVVCGYWLLLRLLDNRVGDPAALGGLAASTGTPAAVMVSIAIGKTLTHFKVPRARGELGEVLKTIVEQPFLGLVICVALVVLPILRRSLAPGWPFGRCISSAATWFGASVRSAPGRMRMALWRVVGMLVEGAQLAFEHPEISVPILAGLGLLLLLAIQ